MVDSSQFNIIRIGIASPENIINWAGGEKNEVKKPETINYRTFKPERDGLFCERIFGPVKDWECHCGRYKKIKHRGIVCDRCGVEVTRSKVRRERMGYVKLIAPVSHIWYLKCVPSPMALLLDMTPRSLEKVIYYADYVVTFANHELIDEKYPAILAAAEQKKQQIMDYLDEDIKEEEALYEERIKDADDKKREQENKKLRDLVAHMTSEANTEAGIIDIGIEVISGRKVKDIISEEEFRAIELVDEMIREFSNGFKLYELFKADTGGAAIKELLSQVNLQETHDKLTKEIIDTAGSNKQVRAIKRLEITDAFIASKAKPEWMVLDNLPIISPELRPMVQLDGGRFATSDLNDLYRRVINRNNRLQKIREINAPASIVNHEKRLLQEAVDAVIDNSRKSRPVTGSNSRPLKSLSDMLKGKEGRFRKNLLGKRVDYSGRSVIVVGPNLKIYQCGLPKEMALELFKPFVMKSLVQKEVASNIKAAKRSIDRMRPEVWDSLEEVIKEHPVLLNRAPTLHRLGIQAFEPILVDGKAIQLHPLVCSAFNADFDGDQMAVHVPLSAAAQAEARALMLASHNLFSPADGRPIVSPSQDVVLGCFYLTMRSDKWIVKYADEDILNEAGEFIVQKNQTYMEHNGQIGKVKMFANSADAILAYQNGNVDLHEMVAVRLNIDGFVSLRNITVGRLIFNNILPENMGYIGTPYLKGNDLKYDPAKRLVLDPKNEPNEKDAIGKKWAGKLITECHERNGHDATVKFLDDMKALGYRYATFAGMSIAITDMDITSDREKIINETEASVEKINRNYIRGIVGLQERRQQVLEKWMNAQERIADSLLDGIEQFNQIAIITMSGARGSTKQISQLAGMRGLMSDPFGNAIEDLPVKSNFHEGLSVLEYFVSTHGARKGLADTALRTADAGYLTRRLVDVAQDVIVREDNCHTKIGINIKPLYDGDSLVENLSDRIKGRTALKNIGDKAFTLTEDVYAFYTPILSEIKIKKTAAQRAEEEIEITQQPKLTLETEQIKLTEQIEAVETVESIDLIPIIEAVEKIDEQPTEEIEIKTEWIVDPTLKPIYIAESEIISFFEQNEIFDINPETKEISVRETGELIADALVMHTEAGDIDPRHAVAVKDEILSDAKAEEIDKLGLDVWIRSPYTCESKLGICSACYGRDLSLKCPVEVGTAVGIIAAQSIGEPGTQLTMRTFHGGGVAGNYLTGVANVKKKKQETLRNIHSDKERGLLSLNESESAKDTKDKNKQVQNLMKVLEDQVHGLLRVVELFEARKPKGQAIVAETEGVVHSVDQKGKNHVVIHATMPIVTNANILAALGSKVACEIKHPETGLRIMKVGDELNDKFLKKLKDANINEITVAKSYLVPHRGNLMVKEGDIITKKGHRLTEGPLDPHKVLELEGELGIMQYIVEEIQKVYKGQGVDINDKHVEVIVRQMLRKVKVIEPNDTDLRKEQLVDKAVVKVKTDKLDQGQTPPTIQAVLKGITDASLATDSFLSAASFQKTTRILTDAAVKDKKDNLIGLKENVIIGRLIPAGTGLKKFRNIELFDRDGNPLQEKKGEYNPTMDKTPLDNFVWNKSVKNCIMDLGCKTVGQLYSRLSDISQYGTGVEREIRQTLTEYMKEKTNRPNFKLETERDSLLSDLLLKTPDEEKAKLINLDDIDLDNDDDIELDSDIDPELEYIDDYDDIDTDDLLNDEGDDISEFVNTTTTEEEDMTNLDDEE